jgi:hypothetical protein
MRRSLVMICFVMGMSIAARNANAVPIVVTGTETTGQVPSDFSMLFDSGQTPALRCSANEDTDACFTSPYTVTGSSGLIVAGQVPANGVTIEVNLWDCPADIVASQCTPANNQKEGSNNLSDQLFLTVTRAAANYSVLWCWDSDLEPNVNICQNDPNRPAGTTVTVYNVAEPLYGYTDLTSFFVAPNGPLAPGQWTVRALSETPEPASLFLVGSGLVAAALCFRKRTVRPPSSSGC